MSANIFSTKNKFGNFLTFFKKKAALVFVERFFEIFRRKRFGSALLNLFIKQCKSKEPVIYVNNLIQCPKSYTVVGDYINTMKTTFDFSFDLNQAVKQHGYA